MRHASHPVAHDIHAAFLLLNLMLPVKTQALLTDGIPTCSSGLTYQTPALNADVRFADLPWQLVHAALWQIHANLVFALDSDEPEYIHQARIGWRRLRGTVRLLQSIRGLPDMPPTPALHAVMDRLQITRDLDVARLEVLPRAAAQSAAVPTGQWDTLRTALDRAATEQRAALRLLLQSPAAGKAFWQQVLWLAQLHNESLVSLSHKGQPSPAAWAHEQVAHLHHRLKHASQHGHNEATRHRTRIWAKRLRYAIEDLKGLLGRKTHPWLKQAKQIQTHFGAQRDVLVAAALAKQHGFPHLASHILGQNATSK